MAAPRRPLARGGAPPPPPPPRLSSAEATNDILTDVFADTRLPRRSLLPESNPDREPYCCGASLFPNFPTQKSAGESGFLNEFGESLQLEGKYFVRKDSQDFRSPGLWGRCREVRSGHPGHSAEAPSAHAPASSRRTGLRHLRRPWGDQGRRR